jgi:hypothetical protein
MQRGKRHTESGSIMSNRPNLPINQPSDRPSAAPLRALVAAGAVAIALALPGLARAARVSGTFNTYQGQPAAYRDRHFENCATQDTYLAPTHGDGSFAQSLPPGCYDLRAERGAIVRHALMVGVADVALGAVSDLAPLAPARLFQLESLFPTLLYSPAPSTAYIFTRDTTVLPASAPRVTLPPPESEVLTRRKQAEAATGGESPSAPGASTNFGSGLFPMKP